MLLTVCGERVVEKTRYRVEHGGFVWVVDVYDGTLAGIVLAKSSWSMKINRFRCRIGSGRK